MWGMNPRTQAAVEHLTLPVSQGATYGGQSNSHVTCEVGNQRNPRSEWKLLGGEGPSCLFPERRDPEMDTQILPRFCGVIFAVQLPWNLPSACSWGPAAPAATRRAHSDSWQPTHSGFMATAPGSKARCTVQTRGWHLRQVQI